VSYSLASSNFLAVRKATYLPAASAPNRSAKMPLAVVGVVEEQQQVAQADQGVRAVGRAGQCVRAPCTSLTTWTRM